MNKVITIMIAIIIIISAIIFGTTIYKKQEYAKSQEEQVEKTKIITEAAEEEILDDCTDEWESIQQEEATQAVPTSTNYEKQEEKQFILRSQNDKIVAFQINEKGEEVEYKTTDISVDYLAEDDKESLKNGIKVTGEEQLNQLIEDFE